MCQLSLEQIQSVQRINAMSIGAFVQKLNESRVLPKSQELSNAKHSIHYDNVKFNYSTGNWSVN